MPQINKILHRIWYGSSLPARYKGFLLRLKTLNPDYSIWLHSDPGSMSKADYEVLQAFCQENKIELRNIREEVLEDSDLIQLELNKSLKRGTDYEKRLCYVRAADVTRLALLYQYGGIYTDTDIIPDQGFGRLEAPEGFLQTYYSGEGNKPYWKTKSGQAYVERVEYDFMASVPGTEFYKVALAIIRCNYQSLQESHDPESWLYSSNFFLVVKGTMSLTGLATLDAYNYLLQRKKIRRIEDTYCSVKPFYLDNKDGTWHPPRRERNFFDVSSAPIEKKLTAFQQLAKQKRQALFPFQELERESYHRSMP